MTPDELLCELESLTHDARMKRMVEIGRNATIDANAAATLNALEQGGFYERRLALQSCNGSRDPIRVLRALSDPSRAIRSLAVALLPLLGDDAHVQSALEAIPFKQRRVLLRGLYKRRRYTIIDTFLDALAARGEEQFSRLLPFGSPAVVTCHLEPVLHQLGQSDWRRLTRLHPNIAANALQSQASAMTNLNQRLVWQANPALPLLAEFCPERALTLVRTLSRHIPLARLELQQLTLRRPAEVADLILHSDNTRVSFDRVAHKLDTNVLLALLERKGSTVSGLNVWLQKLTPAQRVVIYTACRSGWRDREGCISLGLMALLPPALREQEGRYHLALPTLATRPTERLSYTAFLPWDEARTILAPFIHNPDAELRVAALTALIFATRFQRQRLPELLLTVRYRRNEQDPVRCAMLSGLADLPPGIWRTQHLDSLGQIIRDALDAADQSYATVAAAERLIVALLPRHPAWAADWLATLVLERGQISFYNLGVRLSNADVRRIAPVLLPVLQSWETREREIHLIAVAQTLGQRLRVFDGLVDILERILKETRNSWIASLALALIAKHCRERMTSLIPELLNSDPSWVTQQIVYSYLHRYRQDLLTPFLGQQAYSGRFSTGKTRFVLPLFNGFYRWTPQQQALFAATLSSVAGDSVRDSPTIITSIAQLAALIAVPPARLIELASDPRQAVRDTALRALGRLDAGQGVPTLLAAMADDRARIAIYALRRSLLEMPVTQALPLLRSVPLEKVTVAKEVVRLLGELSSESAYQELLALDNRELHRDVRVALLRALWSHLERPQTWAILERAAVSPDAALAASAARIPVERLSSDAQQRLVALLATLLVHPDPTVRLDVLRRCGHLPVADTEQLLLLRLLEAMGSFLPDESNAAASAVFATYTGENAHLVGLAIQRLIANRRVLQTAMRALKAALTMSREQLLPTARAVLEALATDPLTVSLRVEIAIQALPWDELTALLTRLSDEGEMHAEALALAVQTIRHASIDATNLENLEAALANDSDERLRRLALAALVAQSQSSGWDSQRLERLYSYRTDPSPMVAAAAQFTLPPVEL